MRVSASQASVVCTLMDSDSGSEGKSTCLVMSGGSVDHNRLFEVLENDFMPMVERAYPIVAELRSQLDRAGARATSMSGSGSTVFGIFDDRMAASQAQVALQGRGFRSFLCQPTPISVP